MTLPCLWCAGPLQQQATGRPRLYCSGACRKAACCFRREVEGYLVRFGELGAPTPRRQLVIAEVRAERVAYYQRHRRAARRGSFRRAERTLAAID